MTGWLIRAATAQDAAGVRRCIDAAYAGYRDQGIDLPDVSGGIEAEIADHLVFVASEGPQIIAGMVLELGDGYLQLANVAVHPDYGGKGIGKAMLARAQAETIAAGLSLLKLATHVEMPRNIALYQRLGWIETGREGVKVLMEKQL